MRYGSGSGSGSFYNQAKIGRKPLIPTGLWFLFDFLSSKNDVNVASKNDKSYNLEIILSLVCKHYEK
jgi:hypothetical protein